MRLCDIDAIHFDLDGTLIDSVPDLTLAVRDMCRRFGLPIYDETQVRMWVGNGSAVLVRRALAGKRDIDEATIDEARFKEAHAAFLEAYDAHLCEATRPYPGVTETLRALQAQGYRLSIITNKPTRFLPKLLERLALAPYFDAVAGGDSFEAKKPDALPLKRMCEKLKVPVARALMVGDSRNDLLAAQACGMRAVGVSYGYNYDEDLRMYDPVAVIDRFDALRSILQQGER